MRMTETAVVAELDQIRAALDELLPRLVPVLDRLDAVAAAFGELVPAGVSDEVLAAATTRVGLVDAWDRLEAAGIAL